MELGTFGVLLAGATLAIVVQASSVTRLQRAGAYLIGGGIGGFVVLLSVVVRVRNICGTGGGQVQSASGTSYECFSVETLWFLLSYGALACLGALMMFLARRRRATSTLSLQS